MKKPLIGINPYYFQYRDTFWNATKENYYQAVWLSGGIPVTVHYPMNDDGIEELVDKIDGLLMVGGPDLPNELYHGERPDLLDEDIIDPKRESFDRNLFIAVKKKGEPILSICAGFQHINVLYGGTLYEDLVAQRPGKVNHGEFNGQWSEHTVTLEDGSLVKRVMGVRNTVVISTHHQGIRELGTGLVVTARSEDGLVEAFEDKTVPEAFLAIQWHPEIGIRQPEQLRLFQWLAREAELRRNHR